MSIGISSQPYQSPSAALDFSAFNDDKPQTGSSVPQNTQQSIDPGSLLFATEKQQNVSFGEPTKPVNPVDQTKASDSESDPVKLLTALVTSLIQMLMKLLTGQGTNPADDQSKEQDPFQNSGGLGSDPAESGDDGYSTNETGGGGGYTPDATGGTGGETPETTSGNGGGKSSTEGDDKGDSGSTTQAGGNSGSTPSTTGSAGTGSVNVPTSSGKEKIVDNTIVVHAGETYDGHNQTFSASSKLGSGNQSEDQKPLFELEEGATLKNVILGKDEADGIHVKAANDKAVNIDNVHWTDVGEDALTVKGEGGAKITNLNITNSSAQGADDKIFQLNANTNIKIDNFKADNFGTFLRPNGGKQFDEMNIELNNVEANHGKFAFVKGEDEGMKVTTSNIKLDDVKHAYDKLTPSAQLNQL